MLVPRIPINAPKKVGVRGVFNAAFNFTQDTGTGRWTLNAVTLRVNYMSQNSQALTVPTQ